MREGTLNITAMNRGQIGSIKTLWTKLNAHHLSKSTNFKNHFSAITFEKRMEALKRRDRLIAYVAQDNNENIGYCMASVEGLMGEIDSLFVDAAYRGQGVGQELMSISLKWLEEQNCEIIRVAIAEGNESVLDFYRRFGFAKRLVVMEKMHNGAMRHAKKWLE
jgi:ribosomal protein S18 acetylase RimI-like enzyme